MGPYATRLRMKPQVVFLSPPLVLLSFFLLETFAANHFPSWSVLLIFAPVGEEAFKLLGASSPLILAALMVRRGRRSGQSEPALRHVDRRWLFVCPVLAGLAFGTFEHFASPSYITEEATAFEVRLLIHAGYVSADFLAFLLLWHRGRPVLGGVLSGVVVGAALHSMNNYLADFVANEPAVVALIWFVAAAALPLALLFVLVFSPEDRLRSGVRDALFGI